MIQHGLGDEARHRLRVSDMELLASVYSESSPFDGQEDEG